MLTFIDVKFIFDSSRLGLLLFVLQIADVALRVVFLLFLPCFQLSFRLVRTNEFSYNTQKPLDSQKRMLLFYEQH